MSPFLLAFINLSTRLDWGFGNPNKTAAFIATLMIAVWGLAYIWRKGFWVSLAAFAGLGFCLLLTLSRGGVVALLAGLIPLLVYAPRPWPRNRVLAIVLVSFALFLAGASLERGNRFINGIATRDASITNRLEIWKMAPKMMTDAPGGWGLENAGNAYMHWYQPVDSAEGYRTLISSHLTWLVEFGWWGRFWYSTGWLFLLALCWCRRREVAWTIAFSVWIVFATASMVSSVAEEWVLWVLPLVTLVIALKAQCACLLFHAARSSVFALSSGLVLIMAFARFGGQFKTDPEIAFGGGVVTVGSGEERIVVWTDQDVLGDDFGKRVRKEIPMLTVIFPTSEKPFPNMKQPATFIFTGRSETGDLAKSPVKNGSYVFLNPKSSPPSGLNPKENKIYTFFGEFATSTAINEWINSGIPVFEIPSSGDYLDDWPTLIKNITSLKREDAKNTLKNYENYDN